MLCSPCGAASQSSCSTEKQEEKPNITNLTIEQEHDHYQNHEKRRVEYTNNEDFKRISDEINITLKLDRIEPDLPSEPPKLLAIPISNDLQKLIESKGEPNEVWKMALRRFEEEEILIDDPFKGIGTNAKKLASAEEKQQIIKSLFSNLKVKTDSITKNIEIKRPHEYWETWFNNAYKSQIEQFLAEQNFTLTII